MSAIEIRGKFVKLLADVEDTATLEQMFAYCLALVKGEHPLAEFPPEFIAELEEAIADSDDESDTLDNEEAFKMFRQWAKNNMEAQIAASNQGN
jgi:hypothetical protein